MNELPVELADIVEPVQILSQNSQHPGLLMIALGLGIAVLAALYWWLRNKRRWRTLRRLRQLRHACIAGRMSARELAYAVALELRGGLRIHRLQNIHPLLQADDRRCADWHSFIARLDTLRYQPGGESRPAQVDAMLREAAYWARRLR